MKTGVGQGLIQSISRFNPLFPASALLVLGGVYMVLGPERFSRPEQTALLMGAMSVYQLAVMASIAFLLKKFGPRRDVMSLIAVAGVLLADAPFFHATFAALDPRAGMAVAIGSLVLAAVEIAAISRISGGGRFFGLPSGFIVTGGLLVLLFYTSPSFIAMGRFFRNGAGIDPGGIIGLVFAMSFVPMLFSAPGAGFVVLAGGVLLSIYLKKLLSPESGTPEDGDRSRQGVPARGKRHSFSLYSKVDPKSAGAVLVIAILFFAGFGFSPHVHSDTCPNLPGSPAQGEVRWISPRLPS